MRIQKPCSTSGVVTLSAGDNIWNNDNVTGSYSISGVAKDGSFGWLAKGSALEVFSLESGQRLAAWCFGALIKDPETFVTAVCEFEDDRSAASCLVVASTTLNPRVPGGTICLFDVHRSTVVKAVQFPCEVTSLVTVFSSYPPESLSLLFCPRLQAFCGIVAVGTQAGHLYLLDMCADDVGISNELTPGQAQIMRPTDSGVVVLRNKAGKFNHLCIMLAGLSSDEELFDYHYLGSNGEPEQNQFKSSEVNVTCLHFVRQTLTLLVGYTFGGFQLWDLTVPALRYSSPCDENMPAVIHFAFQEPENDPRDFCYVWVVHGPVSSDPVINVSSHASLYQLCYQRKKWVDNFGFLYERLSSLAVRFNHELHLEPYDSVGNPQCGSRVVSCYTLEDHGFKSSAVNINETLPDEGLSPDRSLCVFVWEAFPHDKQASNCCFLAIFDLNRWYHGQLPSSLSCYRNQRSICPYWSVCSLDEAVQKMCPDLLLMAFVNFKELNRFFSPFNPQSEKFLYPSSLAFNVYSISDGGIVISKFLGIQRLILGYIQKNGFDVLLDPDEICMASVKSGLINIDSPNSKLTLVQRRELLLSMALDYSLIGFILSCIRQLAKSEFLAEGMTLRTFLEWSWKKLTDCKESIDRLCVPLFDWCPIGFNEHDVKQLYHHQVLVSHLVSVFEALNACSSDITDQGKEEIATRLNVVNLVAEYLNVIIWFQSVGLLPEHSEDEVLNRDQFAFPARTLTAAYADRRRSIRQLNSDAHPSSVLVIDGLLVTEGGSISKLFEDKCGRGLYPPSNFHAVVSMFLLPDVAVETKQMVLLYLLKDLASLTDSDETEKMEDIFRQFCCHFHILPSFCRHVQGIWHLDHQQFERAAAELLDVNDSDRVEPWKHDFIVRAFLCQGYERLALKYTKLKSVPALTADDVKLRMTVLLANGLTAEALRYQRAHRDVSLMDDLMGHLILACLETNTIGQLLNLSMTKEEEGHLVHYLKHSNNPTCRRLLVLYYLRQARVTDAVHFNDLQSPQQLNGDREKILKSVVDGYKKVLPSVQRKMGFCVGSDHHFSKIYKEYSRPTPLSSDLHLQQRDQLVTRATMLNAVLDKVHQINFPESHLLETMSSSEKGPRPSVIERASLFDTPIVSLGIKKSHLSITNDVIFPSSAIVGTPQSRFGRNSPQPLAGSVTKRLYSAAALSVLQTPPVTRLRSILAHENTQRTPIPHSILSTKRLKLSDEIAKESSRMAGKLTFDETADVTTDDQQRRRKARVSGSSASAKSKALRFLEPETAASADLRTDSRQELTEVPVFDHHHDSETPGVLDGEIEMNISAPEDEFADVDEVCEVTTARLTSSSDFQYENSNPPSATSAPKEAESLDEFTSVSFSYCHESVKDGTTAWLTTELEPGVLEVDEEMDLSEKVTFEPSASEELMKGDVASSSGPDLPASVSGGFSGSSLQRPPLWEHDMWMQTPAAGSDLKPHLCAGNFDEMGNRAEKEFGIQNPSDFEEQLKRSPNQQVFESVKVESKSSETLRSPGRKRSTRSPSREVSDSDGQIRASTRRSVRSPGREMIDPVHENLEGGREDEVDRPRTPIRRRSVRSPGREGIDPSLQDLQEDEKINAPDGTKASPGRRRSVRSPGRQMINQTGEHLEKDATEEAVDETKMPLGQRSGSLPGYKMDDLPQEIPRIDEKEPEMLSRDKSVVLPVDETSDDQPKTSRRRSLRSPGREAVDPSATNNEKETEDQHKASSRRRSLRSPGREVTMENSADEKETEAQSKTSSRRRSLRSPGREVVNPAMKNEKETEEEHMTSSRRRSLRSPGREAVDPSTPHDEKDSDQPKTSSRRRSLRSPGREGFEPSMKNSGAEKEAEDQPKTSSRRRSLRSPSREAVDPSTTADAKETEDQPKTSSRRRSLRSPGREMIDPSLKNSGDEKEAEDQPRTSSRRRSLRSPSREAVTQFVEGTPGEEKKQSTGKLLHEHTSDTHKVVSTTSSGSAQLSSHEDAERANEKPEKADARSSTRVRRSPGREIGDLFDQTAASLDKESELRSKSIPSEDVEVKTALSAQRRFVRSPSRERVFIDDVGLTPIRRSLRQREKLEKERDPDGMEMTSDKTFQTETPVTPKSVSKRAAGDGEVKESGLHQQLSKVSKSVVLSVLKTPRKPVTRSDTKLFREKEVLKSGEKANVSVADIRQPSSRSPGRSAKRRSVEREVVFDAPVVEIPSSSVVAQPSDTEMVEKSSHETVFTESNVRQRQFIFSMPLAASDKFPDLSFEEKDVIAARHSQFVFSPPHTHLRDRPPPVVPSVSSEADKVDEELGDDKEMVRIRTESASKKTKVVKSRKMSSEKRSSMARKPKSEDIPILLSPISDAEPSPPKVSTVPKKKHSIRSSYVTRSKRKKLSAFDPTLIF